MCFCIGIILSIIDILRNISVLEGHTIGTIFFFCFLIMVLYGLLGFLIDLIWDLIKWFINR